ncbi:hypothetical protein CANINC_000677 [Pichia inconspicua]|uniref:Dolichyl-phosphate-mannose--protein mannosyltransferase n=1 Tax=Pichia inconspicua TaxID=52247 RepID=A0A4T0X5L6_9ASCO|nr:hypothetical protein CANINC_000677 [[Candida] inconspicua]
MGMKNRQLSRTELQELKELRRLFDRRRSTLHSDSSSGSIEEHDNTRESSIAFTSGADVISTKEDLFKKDFDFKADNSPRKSVDKGKKKIKSKTYEKLTLLKVVNHYIAPIMFTILSFYIRHNDIGVNKTVIWDEAHFAKFGSFYNKHTFYHDVHPPLGKMLCGLSEWLVGYNPNTSPDFKFDSGSSYPADINIYEGKSGKVNLWFTLLGISIGCVCSVKWVGLFVTGVVGIYTIVDLWAKFWDPKFKLFNYIKFWLRRVFFLIIIPVSLYMFFFKIHLDLLYLPGEGSGSMNTLFQANMKNTDILAQPRLVQVNDVVTLRSQGMNSNLLHSHQQIYPEGSRQHQVTTYGFKDMNNNWKISNPRSATELNDFIKDGDIIRLFHVLTRSNLHSHEIPGHISKQYWEVSGYGDETVGDAKDDWIVEIVDQLHSSNSTYSELYEKNDQFYKYLHPVSTTFRLKHKVLGCYLGTTGASYPTWGFQQGEVVCLDPKKSFGGSSANWNIESVVESTLPIVKEYKYPKSNFFKDFIQLQRSMAASNNALTPDPSKNDNIASSWWEWPIMRRGIRMSSWSSSTLRYYMFGNPIIIWFTTISVSIYIFVMISIARKWINQQLVLDESAMWTLFTTAIIPLLGYAFHYVPFIVMGRVTYFHHYVPALYFAIFMAGFIVDYFTSFSSPLIKRSIYLVLYVIIISSFWLFHPTCLGMTGPVRDYSYLNWFTTWEIAPYMPFKQAVPVILKLARKQLGL